MIEKLRRRMIWISVCSFLSVFLLLFGLLYFFQQRQMTETLDMLTEYIAAAVSEYEPGSHEKRPRFSGAPEISPSQETRTFVIRFDAEGNLLDSSHPQHILRLADMARSCKTNRGWQDKYRYRTQETESGMIVVLANSTRMQENNSALLNSTGTVLTVGLAAVITLIVLFSRLAVRPMAESYRKQRQFVTDANHELKTPLTLILTNLDILESQAGTSEWLDDIRTEGRRMTQLVNRLTALSRLDESELISAGERFSLSDAAADTIAEFLPLAKRSGLTLTADIQPDVAIQGNEGEIRQVIAILLDNAVKYCDPSGAIHLTLHGGRHPVLTAENTFRAVDSLELQRLFDRFYRADPARTAGNSFGIGLSLAQGIVHRHRSSITAYKAGTDRIGFRIAWK